MHLINCLKLRLDKRFVADAEAMSAVDEFLKNIPGRILEVELDETKSGKMGITRDDSIYKYGILLENNMVFLEFFNNRNQGMPTMGIYIDNQTPQITIKGSKAEKQFVLSFSIKDDKVKKITRYVD